MADKLTAHPILTYLIFIMPALLLVLGIMLKANVFLLIAVCAWLGTALVLLFLPLESDSAAQ